MNVMNLIEERAKNVCPRIIFPEAGEIRILQIAEQAVKRQTAQPLLIGNEEEIKKLAGENDICLDGSAIISPTEDIIDDYAGRFSLEQPIMSAKAIRRKLKDPLCFAACAVHYGDADSLIAGYRYTTGEVILAAEIFIGRMEGINTVSSFNVVTVPGFEGSEKDTVIFTDVAVCVRPSSEQLADIASLAADASRKLLGWEPRVAFLSYSTKGSGEGEDVDKVIRALSILKERRADIIADGEFQLEVALNRAAAQKKLNDIGEVAGRANILVFPDINAGNTNIKAVKLFAHANSIGPILTGFRRPVSDLSRTGSLEHLLSTVSSVAALCSEE